MTFTIRNHRLWRDGRHVETLPSPNTGGAFAETPRFLVVHFTAGASARSSAEWFRSPDNRSSSAHLVIDRDGTPIQCVALDTVAWHAGRSQWKGVAGLNSRSIGLELANWGALTRRGGGWTTPSGVAVADPVLAIHRDGNPDGSRTPIGWEPYPAAQIEATTEIARRLVAAYGITEILGHDDIAPTRKCDPGPAFDMARFRAAVLGAARREDGDPALVVTPADGLNLRSGPGTGWSVVELLTLGTRVIPHERDGRWLSVGVLGADGAPRRTGWVHEAYLA
ncbi:MAG: N-acetylmuramoyl-L-alanine amidase [Siculibacillus sp.]|nr:N-acetylmuramoyl-L-alanine amidase [Siculibacillus sp.]